MTDDIPFCDTHFRKREFRVATVRLGVSVDGVTVCTACALNVVRTSRLIGAIRPITRKEDT